MYADRSYKPLSDPERTRRWDQYISDLDEFIQDSNEPVHASPLRIKFDSTLCEDEDDYEEDYDSTAIKIEERLRSLTLWLVSGPSQGLMVHLMSLTLKPNECIPAYLKIYLFRD
ncbi:hypothetical protein PIIN_10227 [Serendipita indica DSM 11827]|uniref:Uncharacterized protein n=1 Tax=Serendipita indica (strain DSM 11827) TaxID=1109443 RepID=G4TY42_SERID|nr:hypothetical protein PIIN_10227 [Serendipita indica DSM 11827]